VEDSQEMNTMSDFRNKLYTENTGISYFSVSQENSASSIIGQYKRYQKNLENKPVIMFVGEPGKHRFRVCKIQIKKNTLTAAFLQNV